MKLPVSGRAAAAALVALSLALFGCATSDNWHYVRQRPRQTAETEATVISHPAGAEVFLNGTYMGVAPFVVPIRYPYDLRVFERRVLLPTPHIEEKEVPTYLRNEFTFQFHWSGGKSESVKITLHGEEKVEVSAGEAPGA